MELSKGLCTPLVKVIHLEVIIVGEIPQRAASACISGKRAVSTAFALDFARAKADIFHSF